jgi:hypothetical protein
MRTFISKIKKTGNELVTMKTDAGLILIRKNCIESWEDNADENKRDYAVKIRLTSGRILYMTEEEFVKYWELKKEGKI